MSYNLSAADRGVIVHAISEAELSCQYALAEDLRAILTRASAVTVAEPKAGQHCVRCGGTFGGWCDCSDNRAACARQQVEQYLASSDPEGHRQSIIDHEAEQQAEPAADEWAEFETALKQYAEACYRSESCSAMDAARARVCAIFSRAAQSGQRAGVADDTARLDWLDEQNRKKNASHGTMYGWGYSVNCNRIALEDHHWPARTVREALDAAMLAAPTQQPSTDQS